MPVNAEKRAYEDRLNGLLDKYSKVIFVGMDNVTSQQVHKVRKDLRGKGELLMGKKTHQKRIISNRAEKGNDKDKLMRSKFVEENLLTSNRGLLFTDCDLAEISTILQRHRKNAPARVGAIAPCDVVIQAGNTGLEPTTTSFFQALNIATKIAKGTVEIVSDKKVLSQGEKVDNSTAALLQKLKISPFFYEVEVQFVWDRGVLFTKDDLAVTDEKIGEWVTQGLSNVTALSLGAGIPTEASFPHLLMDAFKNLLAISVETEYEFTEFNGKQLRADIKSGKVAASSSASAAPAAAAKPSGKEAAKPAAKPAPVVEEEEDDVGLGGLF
jgi:large subunit ribosomal protein LP0